MQRLLPLVTNFLVLIVLIFLTHSLKANYEISRKVETTQGLELASLNPYFQESATRIYMSKLYDYGVNNQDREALKAFSEWMSQEIYFTPHPMSFSLLISTYQMLGIKDKACEYTKTAYGIYPLNEQFGKILQNCIK